MNNNRTYQFPFARYPAIRLALFFISGILFDYHLDIPPVIWLIPFCCFISIYLFFEYVHKRSLRSWLLYSALFCYLSSIVCFGGFWHSLFNSQDPPAKATILNSYTWEELSFKGEINQIKKTSSGKYQIDVSVDTTLFPNNLVWTEDYTLRTVLNPKNLRFSPKIIPGNRLHFSAVIYPLEEPRNPHEFNYKAYLASIGIYHQAGLQSIHTIKEAEVALSWNKVRNDVLSAIDHNFSQETADLAKALLIGYKNELIQETKIAFSRAGLSHIMAVSGLHVGFILAPFWIFIPIFWSFRYGKQIGLLLLIGLLIFYAGLTGFSASVSRASLTGGFLMYGRLFHKVRDSKNLTAVAALIILLIHPSDLFSIGFQLSFGAVYIILLTAPVINKTLPDWVRFRWYGTPVMVIIISLIVQLGLFPLLTYYFGEFSLVGPIANALFVPFLGLAVPLAFVFLALSFISPGIAQTLTLPVDYFLYGLHQFVLTTTQWEWSWIQTQTEGIIIFALWASVIFFIATLPIPKLRWKFLILFLSLLCIEQGEHLVQKFRPAPLELTFFDVGQGDAALLKTPQSNKHYLIDTGRWQPGYNSAKYIIIPYLKSEGIDKLDGIFLSHPHADHIGGIVELLNTIPVDTIYNSGANYDSQLFSDYQRIAKQKNIPIVSLKQGQILIPDPALRLFVYAPSEENLANSNVNNSSLIFEILYGSTEFLFMGDAEKRQEQQLTTGYPQLVDTDLLKVGHHGSKTSSTASFLKSISAEMGIVSLADRNRFRHPHPEAVQRLHSETDTLYFTSIDGAIRIISDGNSIKKGRK
ncbi:DNA internalization-related competence protein ComEC/Rec2 [Aliifodinibius salicampi]|uniref:DNA internalization-related competence protein ComEC/Rec2 n=1 Tax=Fodinibius salicampi TaxID=1920655 RepID=A0ABT3Q2R4_9BACT|nr:DNA internalization-related competence protein ComEC/Rec2 [Fodinibius salicampi]